MNPTTELVVYESSEHGPISIHVHWLDAVAVIAARWANNRVYHDRRHRAEMTAMWGKDYSGQLNRVKGQKE